MKNKSQPTIGEYINLRLHHHMHSIKSAGGIDLHGRPLDIGRAAQEIVEEYLHSWNSVRTGFERPAKPIDLLFTDSSLGTFEWGFIPRTPVQGSSVSAFDEENVRYQKHLETMGIKANVVNGKIRVTGN